MSVSSVLFVYLSVRLFVLCVCRLVHVFCLSMCRSILRVCSWWVHVRVRLLVPPPSACVCLIVSYVCLSVWLFVSPCICPSACSVPSAASPTEGLPHRDPIQTSHRGHTPTLHTGLVTLGWFCGTSPVILLQLGDGPACDCPSCSSATALPAVAPLVAQQRPCPLLLLW